MKSHGMKRIKKRFLAGVLTLCMVLTMLPAAALAAGLGSNEPSNDAMVYTDPVIPPTPSYDWYENPEGDAYTISTVADLMGLAKITQNKSKKFSDSVPADDFNGKTVILADNLDLTGVVWVGVDGSTVTADYRIWAFAGTFDGDKHTISNLNFSIKNTSQRYEVGLFHSIAAGGKIRDLTLDTVTAELGTNSLFGSLAYSLTGGAENCTVNHVRVTGENNSSDMYNNYTSVAGMFCSVSLTTSSNKVNSCSVSDMTVSIRGLLRHGGGLAGEVKGQSTFESCSTSEISFQASSARTVGGLFATAQNIIDDVVSVKNCTASDVSITGDENIGYVGGLSGSNNEDTHYEGCKVHGIIIRSTSETGTVGQVGGFVANTQLPGTTRVNTFKNCTVVGLDMRLKGISSDEDSGIGGFSANFSHSTTATGCSVSGAIDTSGVTGGAQTGGFLGNLGWYETTTQLTDCAAHVDILAAGSAGGFIGASAMDYSESSKQVAATFQGCTATGDVKSTDSTAGGFVGDGYCGTYTNCTAGGSVSGKTAGGFWGAITANPHMSKDSQIGISGCKGKGVVLGDENAGGFVATVTTDRSPPQSGKATKVSILGSAASHVVAGLSPNTHVDGFMILTAADDPNVTTGNGGGTANTPAVVILEGTSSAQPTVNADGSISIPPGGKVNGKLFPYGGFITSDGTVHKNSGGGSAVYAVSVLSVQNGTITVNPKSASKGVAVIITVEPDSGYELGELTVTDKYGKELELTDRGDGTYTFAMPSGDVSVAGSFVKAADPDTGLMNGTGETEFSPSLSATRGMIVTILYRLAGSPAVTAASGFTDVAPGAYYADAVAWAAANGIVNGYGNDTFGPNDNVTREQFAAILWRYADSPAASGTLDGFTDAGQISNYAVDAMHWAVEQGVVNGKGNGVLDPKGSAVRAEAAAMLMRYLQTTD